MQLCNWGSAFQRLSSGFTRRRFEAIGLREDIIVSRRAKWTDCFSGPVARPSNKRKEEIRRVSGRNQLVERIESVQISGLMAEVRVSIGGQQITSIITAHSGSEMQLKRGQTAAALIKATDVMILRV